MEQYLEKVETLEPHNFVGFDIKRPLINAI